MNKAVLGAALGAAIIAAGCSLEPWLASSPTPINYVSEPVLASYHCPQQRGPLPGARSRPFFDFNFKLEDQLKFSCTQEGPFKWGERKWYIQRMFRQYLVPAEGGQVTAEQRVVRVCSLDAVIEEGGKPLIAPCERYDKETGPKGCARCMVDPTPPPSR